MRIFCSGLEEQIAHRKYFYKSATLVHEGMIVVHNSGLTGDPTSASVRERERERGGGEGEGEGERERERDQERERETDYLFFFSGGD